MFVPCRRSQSRASRTLVRNLLSTARFAAEYSFSQRSDPTIFMTKAHFTRVPTSPMLRVTTAAAAVLLANSALLGQTASSDPAGRYPFVFQVGPGATTGSTSSAATSIPLVRQSVFRGAPLSKEGDNFVQPLKLNFPAGTFANAQFNPTTTTTYYVELDNGQPQATSGPWKWSGSFCNIATTTDSSVTLLDNSLLDRVVIGTTVITIRPHWTTSTLFGEQNSAGLTSGNTAGASDCFGVMDPESQMMTVIFYRTNVALGIHDWRIGINIMAANFLIPPNRFISTTRRGGTALNAPLIGEPKTVGTVFEIEPPPESSNPSYGFIANPYPFPSRTLAELGLYTGDPATGVMGGSSEENSGDTLVIQPPYIGSSPTLIVYHYNTTNSRWQRGTVDASADRIPAAGAGYILRKPGSGGQAFTFFLPPPSEVLPFSH